MSYFKYYFDEEESTNLNLIAIKNQLGERGSLDRSTTTTGFNIINYKVLRLCYEYVTKMELHIYRNLESNSIFMY